MKKNISIKVIVLVGLFIALDILLTRPFATIMMGMQGRITFSFVAMVIAASVLGPYWAMVIAFLSDLLGYSLFPKDGSYFFGYAVTAMLRAFVYGMFFYKKTRIFMPKDNEIGIWNAGAKTATKILLCCIVILILNLLTIPLWNTILYTKPTPDMFMAKYIANILKGLTGNFINFALQVSLIGLIFKYLDSMIKKYEI